jgi:hypothetical protein
MMLWTEADEACHGDRERAIRNLAYQVEQDETMGIIGLYEEAARRAGANVQEIESTIRSARHRRENGS